MSDHNPSDPFDTHPDNSGCSNDDFEQVDAPSSGYYRDNGDADGPDAVGPGVYYGDDFEQDTEVSTTTANVGDEEAEDDLYAAGASEGEAYTHTSEPLISFGEEESYDTQSVEPSAPVPDFDPVIDFANSTGEEILSAFAPSASPPAGHYAQPTSSTKFDDDDFYGISSSETPDIENPTSKYLAEMVQATSSYDPPAPTPVYREEPVASGSKKTDSPTQRQTAQSDDRAEISAGSFLKSIDPREVNEEETELHKPSPFFVDLIYWRDVRKTGTIFGTILLILLALAIFSILTVLAYLFLAILSVTFSFVIYKKIMAAVQKSNSGHPFKTLLELDIYLTEDKLRGIIQTIIKRADATVKELRHLFLVEDIVDSVKFGILLWALTYIGSWFSDLTIIIIVFVLIFTVPKLYEKYQVQIDNYVGLAKAQINRYLSIIQSKVPFLKKKEKAN